MHLPISQLKTEPIQFSSSKILSIHQYSTLLVIYLCGSTTTLFIKAIQDSFTYPFERIYAELAWWLFLLTQFSFQLECFKASYYPYHLASTFFYHPTFVLLPKHFPHPVYNFTQNNFRISNDFSLVMVLPSPPPSLLPSK